MKKKDSIGFVDYLITIFIFAWILSWFFAIWIGSFRGELVFTGLFCFILAALLQETKKT
jgi:hypothetical protein